MTQTDNLRHILSHCRTVAVVGLSPKQHRASFEVAQYMQQHGWRIIPINPVAAASGTQILGEKVYATLTEAAQHEKIELVDVFRNSEDVPPVVAEAIAIGAQAVWLQLGIVNDAAIATAQAAGLRTVQDKCLLVEHAAVRQTGSH
jgi:predicted CoA-binding protein